MVSTKSELSQRRQCNLLNLSRSTLHYTQKGESAENLRFMNIIDKQFIETPYYGSRQMMRLMRLVPIYQEPNTSKGNPDIKFIHPFSKGSISTDPIRSGVPTLPIFQWSEDQGSQFTSDEWTGVLKDAGVRISMDGKGRWIDNRMVERLWRSLKYECVYLQAFETGSQARKAIGKWIHEYNTKRPHSSHGILTPAEAYAGKSEPVTIAA